MNWGALAAQGGSMKISIAFVVNLCVCLSLYALPLYAATLTFWPIEDTWVNETNPDANYATNTYLSLKDRAGLAEAYLRFSNLDIASLEKKQVLDATLYMYQYQGTFSPDDTVQLHAVNTPWDGSTLTWNTRPASDAMPISSCDLNPANNLWRFWPGLEKLICAWAGGNNYGLVLENGSDGKKDELSSRFYSSQYGQLELRPHLEITTAPEATSIPEPTGGILFLTAAGFLVMLHRQRKVDG
jgi:hypothetical protein